MAHALQALSAGLAVPVFAVLAAGVAINGGASPVNTISFAVASGLVLGKTLGVLGATYLTTRLPGARLGPTLRWGDIAALAPLTGSVSPSLCWSVKSRWRRPACSRARRWR
jgi:NhaA family Na+:H+ antiporter